MTEEIDEHFEKGDREYLEKVDFSSIVWQQIHLLNKFASMSGETPEYNDCVLATCYLMRSFKKSKHKDMFLGKIQEIDDEYWKKKKETSSHKISELTNKTARKKHKAIMDFIAESGLSGSSGIAVKTSK